MHLCKVKRYSGTDTVKMSNVERKEGVFTFVEHPRVLVNTLNLFFFKSFFKDLLCHMMNAPKAFYVFPERSNFLGRFAVSQIISVYFCLLVFVAWKYKDSQIPLIFCTEGNTHQLLSFSVALCS